MKIIYEQVHKNARELNKRNEDGGWDLFAAIDEGESILIAPQTTKMIPLGFKTALPINVVGLLRERGSTGKINLKVNAGVVDSGYRGEWFAILYNGGRTSIIISNEEEWRQKEYIQDGSIVVPVGIAIAQVVFVESLNLEISEGLVNNFVSERGVGKLGSTDEKEIK